jgi:Serine/threonine protein kinase
MGLPVALTPGTVVGQHYIVKDLLNMGGFGAVYRGIDTSEHDRPCAIKETYDVTPSARRQALMEASVLFTIRSPHLPEVYDALEVNGRFYLIMQLIEGQNLLQILRARVPGGLVGAQIPYQSAGGPCQEPEVLTWLLPIIDVLQELHSRRPPVMHRDIKPGNIVLKPDNTAVLVDFGLTKLYDPNVNTQTLGRAVTEGFSPLEQYVGKTTPQSDIYSMAATMYLLLTNCLPPAATKRAAQDTLTAPRVLNPALSIKVERALLKALALHVEDRYQSMHEFAEALREPAFDGYNDQTIRVQMPAQTGTSIPSPSSMGQPSSVYAPLPSNQPSNVYTNGYGNQPYPAASAPPFAAGQSFVQPSYSGAGQPGQPGPYAGQQQMSYPGGSAGTSMPGVPSQGGYGQPQPKRSARPKFQPQFNRPLPSPSNQGCIWGLIQGLIAAVLVLFMRQQADFYLGMLVGFLFYAFAGFITTRHDGSLLRGGWAGYWTGIFGTLMFWLSLGVGLAIFFMQHLSALRSTDSGLSAQVANTLAWNAVKPDWPPLPLLVPQQPLLINVLVLLVVGVIVPWLFGFAGALLGRMRHSGR